MYVRPACRVKKILAFSAVAQSAFRGQTECRACVSQAYRSPCAEKHDGPHADINGDGIVDAADFAFVRMNFMDSSKDCCCPGSTAGVAGRTEVSVRELRQMGMSDLTVADLNGDGLVNMDDYCVGHRLSAFLGGQVPSRKAPSRGRTDSSIGSARSGNQR